MNRKRHGINIFIGNCRTSAQNPRTVQEEGMSHHCHCLWIHIHVHAFSFPLPLEAIKKMDPSSSITLRLIATVQYITVGAV
jgi:hypothetical protein